MCFSLCGMVSVQTREGVYWGSASVLNSLCAEILQDKTQNAISAARQPGQLPGREPAGHSTQLWRGGGSHIAEPDVATLGVIPLQAGDFRFQTLSVLISKLEKSPLEYRKQRIALVASVSFRDSCLDLT